MPQKKTIKKTAKPVVKKSAAGSKKVAPAKKAAPKAAKKLVKKQAPTKPKSVVKPKAKAVSSKKSMPKVVAKSAKTIKKSAAPVKLCNSVIKNESKTVVNKPDKQNKSMSKQKNQEEKPIEKKAAKKPEPVKEVKLPKINAKTSVPYQPSYKPLEQRQDMVRSSEPLVRYTDTELNEFRELIQRKLNAAKKELAYLQGLNYPQR